MKIGIDYRPALRPNSRRRGIGRFTRQMVEALVQCGSGHEFILYSLGNSAPKLSGEASIRRIPHLPRPNRLNWLLDRITLPRCIARDRLDLFHATEFTSIPGRRCGTPVVATVHDLIPFVFWEETARSTPADFRLALKLGLKRIAGCRLVLTDSEHSRRDLLERLDLDPDRIQVVYPGCGRSLRPWDPESARRLLAQDFGVRTPFLFYVGGTDFRKNLVRLVKAFGRLHRRGYPGVLVLGGESFLWNIPEVQEVRRVVDSEGLSERVACPGFIPDEVLGAFYSACDCFVFPSLYEGFGLPVLEAMRCGAPVVTSPVSSLPEVAGEAAVYVDPKEEDDIAEGVSRFLDDTDGLREKSRKEGLLRASRFDWNRSARRILDLYERYGTG